MDGALLLRWIIPKCKGKLLYYLQELICRQAFAQGYLNVASGSDVSSNNHIRPILNPILDLVSQASI